MDRLEFVNRWFNTDQFLSSGRAKLVAMDEEHAIVTMTIYPAILNIAGTVHGGALYTLADNVAGIAAAGDGRYYVTLSGGLNYLRSQREGQIRAEATVMHRGSSTCMINVNIYGDNNKLLATGDFNFFVANKKNGSRAPSKEVNNGAQA